MTYRKATTFGDADIAAQVLAARTPQACKALGRRVRGFDDARWSAVRGDVARDACTLKFSQNPLLLEQLLATGDAELVEASPTDRLWGIGFSAEDAPANRARWGLNLLGRALMDVRAALRGDPLRG